MCSLKGMNRFVRYVSPRCDRLVYNASVRAFSASVALFSEEVRVSADERPDGVSFMIVVIFGENAEDVVSAIACGGSIATTSHLLLTWLAFAVMLRHVWLGYESGDRHLQIVVARSHGPERAFRALL